MSYIKKCLRLLGALLLLMLTSIIPKNQNIIIYGAWIGKKFGDNPKYLFLAANEENDEIRNIWISKDKQIVEYVNSLGYESYYAYSLKGIIYQIISQKVVVCVGMSDVVLPLMGGKIIIQLWHGVVIKKIMYDQYTPNVAERLKYNFLKKQYILYTNYKNYNQIFKRAFNVDEKHLLLSGQPRNDLFFRSDWVDGDMLKRFKECSKGNKTVLYMPTHRSEGKKNMEIEKHIELEKINTICLKEGYTFIINKHPYHQHEERIMGYSNICDITGLGFDSQFLLSMGDILITDFSSCYMDYLLRDKPILFYQYDLEEYKQDERDFYYFGDEIMPGPIDTTFDDLVTDLTDIIAEKNDAYELKRKIARNFFYDKECQGLSGSALYKRIKNIRD